MSTETYYEIQKRLRLSGLNFTQIAGRLGTTRQHLRHAILGQWKGPRALTIVNDLCRELGIKPEECLEPQEAQA